MARKWKTGDWLLLGAFLVLLCLALLLPRPEWTVLAFIAGILLFVRLLVLLCRKLMWKIRNRLIISGIFFIVTPIVLLSVLFYMIGSLLIFQYNSLIFENIMQRDLTGLERVVEVALNAKDEAGVIAAVDRFTRRNPRFLKMAFFSRKEGRWALFHHYPEEFPCERMDAGLFLKHLPSGYFRFNGELHQGVARAEAGIAAVAFETINQDYFNLLPRLGDYKVMYQPVSEGPIVRQLQKVTRRLESDEFAAFDKYRWPFAYDFRYRDFDDVKAGAPALKYFSFFIINDYAKAFQRLRGVDPARYLSREIRALEAEVARMPAGSVREARQARLAELERELEAVRGSRGEWGNSLIPPLIKIVVAVFAFFIIGSIFIGLRMIRVITQSVSQLTKGLEKMRRGDFSYRIRIKARDQMHFLAESFNEMSAGIGRLLSEEKERQRLEEELRVARSIQIKLLPPDHFCGGGIEIAAVNIPAQEIAGDYFDYFYEAGEHLTVLVADVSGKGASAAFYMAELKGVMNYLRSREPSPAGMIAECHRSLLPSFDKMTFITMNLARFDLRGRTLRFARSGHTPAIFYDSSAAACRELTPPGPAIGLAQFSRSAIEEMEMPWSSGDILFFFSDGLSEMMNPEGEVFGVQALSGLIAGNAGRPAAEIRQRILDAAVAFAGDKANRDDLTFVVVKIA